MQMDIQSSGFTLTGGMRDYLMKRLAYSLNHGNESITRLVVWLSDINGPRGGADKRCVIEMRLKASLAVVIEDTEADLYVAIDRATERAGHTLTRRLARQRKFTSDKFVTQVEADQGEGVAAAQQPNS